MSNNSNNNVNITFLRFCGILTTIVQSTWSDALEINESIYYVYLWMYLEGEHCCLHRCGVGDNLSVQPPTDGFERGLFWVIENFTTGFGNLQNG